MPKIFTASYTFDLEEEIKSDLSAELAKSIDEEIIREIEIGHLVACGWYKVELPRFNSMMHAVDIAEWVDGNCGQHIRHGSTFVFKEAKDATWFRMRWCGE